jgi:hypothetical protein
MEVDQRRRPFAVEPRTHDRDQSDDVIDRLRLQLIENRSRLVGRQELDERHTQASGIV